MTYKPSPSCTYHEGDETCFRKDCPICCVRNYRDAQDSDIPLVTIQKRPEHEHAPGWWQTHFGRRVSHVG